MTLFSKAFSSPLSRRIIRGASWNLLATILSRGIPPLAMIIVARLLEKSEFGKLGTVQSSVTMFVALAAAGMGITASKHVAEYRHNHKQSAGRIITLSTVASTTTGLMMASLMFFFAPWMASTILAAPELSAPLKIGAFILAFKAIIGVQNGILTGFEAFRLMSFANAASGMIMFAMIIYGTYLEGLLGALWGLLGAAGISVIVNTFIICRLMILEKIPFTLRITNKEWRIMWYYSLPALIGAIMISPVHWTGVALLVNQPEGYAEMAVFSAANQWFSLLLFLPGVITNTLMPVFSDFAGKGDIIQLRKSLKMGVSMIAMFIIPMSVVAIAGSPYIMTLYGSDYSAGWPVFVAIVLAALAAGVLNLFGNMLAAFNKMWARLFADMAWASVYIICAYLFLRHYNYGALGLALAMLVAYLVKTLIVCLILGIHLRGSKRLEKEYVEIN